MQKSPTVPHASTLQAFLSLVADPPARPHVKSPLADQAEIEKLLDRPDAGLRNQNLFQLKKIVRMAAIAGSAPSEAVTAVDIIWDATKRCRWLAPLSEVGPWRAAIGIALDVATHRDPGQYHLKHFSREHAVVHAAQRLARRGYAFDIADGGLHLQANAFKRLCIRIDKLVSALGGRPVAERIIHEYTRSGRLFDGSLLYGRAVSQIGGMRYPSIPWHYLFQLAIKHLHRRSSTRDAEADWPLLVELSRDLCATFDVEPYSSFDGLDVAPKGIQNTLQDLVLYDEMFSFQQWQPKHSAELLDSWLSSLSEQGYPQPGSAPAGWQLLARSLLTVAATDRFVVTSPCHHVSDALADDMVTAMLKQMAAGSQRSNAGYLTPLDTPKRTAPYIPLFSLDGGNYLLPPKALLARALYEWFYKRLRETKQAILTPPSKPLENTMGAALEHLVVASAQHIAHDRIIAARKYHDPLSKKEPEIDILVETDERIFLIECKKKPLTNLARGGNPLRAILDLSAALLQMLVQLARHERVLRSVGEIVFVDGSKVSLDGREIEKIAVTMLDHGSLQDRMFISAVVRGLFGAQLVANLPGQQETLTTVNKTLAELQTELTALAGPAEDGDIRELLRVYAIDTWWLGIDALHYFCRENADLWAALRPMRHLSFRTGDLMTEMSYLRRSKIIT
jgi:hypothetical protein